MSINDGAPEVAGLSIVKKEAFEIDAEIESHFGRDRHRIAPAYLAIAGVQELLRTQAIPLVMAVHDLGYYKKTSPARLEMATNLPENKSFVFPKNQIKKLNWHRYIRTLGAGSVASMLGANEKLLTEAAVEADIEPAVPPAVAITGDGEPNEERYNKDQIMELDEALKEYEAPANYIAEDDLMTRLGISKHNLTEIKKRLDIHGGWYLHRGFGKRVRHLNNEDAARIFASYVQDYR